MTENIGNNSSKSQKNTFTDTNPYSLPPRLQTSTPRLNNEPMYRGFGKIDSAPYVPSLDKATRRRQEIQDPQPRSQYHHGRDIPYTNKNGMIHSSSFKPINLYENYSSEVNIYNQGRSSTDRNVNNVLSSGGETGLPETRIANNMYPNMMPDSRYSSPWQRPPYISYQYQNNHWQQSKKFVPEVAAHVECTADVKPLDVLSGRGGATNSHSGNAEFRAIVERHKVEYLNAKKSDKPAVAAKIVDIIRSKGGRFLRKYMLPNSQDPCLDPNGNVLWYDIGDEKAREKTCQALREGAPEIRRRSDERREDFSEEEEISKSDVTNDQTGKEMNLKTNAIKAHTVVSSPSVTTHERSNSSSSASYFALEGAATTPPSRKDDSSKVTKLDSKSTYSGSMPNDAFITMKDDGRSSTPIRQKNNSERDMIHVIRPYYHLLPNIATTEFSMQLTKEQKEIYIEAFLPPSPQIQRKVKVNKTLWAKQSHRGFPETQF